MALEERPGHVSRGVLSHLKTSLLHRISFFFFGSRTDRLRQAESHEWVGEGKLSKHFNISIFASVLDRDSHGARRCVDRERERAAVRSRGQDLR